MSSIFDNSTIKEKCQKFTPAEMVETMLDLCEYKDNIIGKKVLENSFGSGNILKAIVKRYIEDGFTQNLTSEVIANCLAEDIYGIEYDDQLYRKCLHELNVMVAEYNLPKVKWSLYNKDALSIQWNKKFDYVIGNPPYIMYKDIDADSKKRLKTTYKTCEKGKFDYCYAFIESGINSLNETGKLVQLIPNNIYKNVFAKKLRDMLKEHITVILDYPTKKIIVLKKKKKI